MEPKRNPTVDVSINSVKGLKEVDSRKLLQNSSDTNLESKNHSDTKKVEEKSDTSSIKVFKMNEDTEGGWEVAGGGRKKSKSKLKQVPGNNNAQSYQNGINANTKSQIKESYGGQKGSQRKLSTLTSTNTFANKKPMTDKKDKNKNIASKHDKNSSAISNPARNNTNQKDASLLVSPIAGSDNCPNDRDVSEIDVELKITDKLSSTIVSNGELSSYAHSNTPETKQPDSLPRINSDSNGNILVNSLDKNSVINDAPREKELHLKDKVGQATKVKPISSTPCVLKDIRASENYADISSQTNSAAENSHQPKSRPNPQLESSASLADIHIILAKGEHNTDSLVESNVSFQDYVESKTTHCFTSNGICTSSNDEETNTQNEIQGIEKIVLLSAIILRLKIAMIDEKYTVLRAPKIESISVNYNIINTLLIL